MEELCERLEEEKKEYRKYIKKGSKGLIKTKR